jgi:hypothetical protein
LSAVSYQPSAVIYQLSAINQGSDDKFDKVSTTDRIAGAAGLAALTMYMATPA